MQHNDELLKDILEMFRMTDKYNEWRKLIDEVPYDYKDYEEHIKNEKIRLNNQKVKSSPKPFTRRIRRSQNK